MNSSQFVHTHVHTQYSIVDGLSTVENLVQDAVKKGMPALAVTEKNNLFSALKFYSCAIEHGIKPIIGCDLSVNYAPEDPSAVGDVVFLCTNRCGYENLNRLVSKACVEGKKGGQATAHYEWIKEHQEGLIVLSGGAGGDIAQALRARNNKRLEAALAFWMETFGDRYYLEISDTGRPGEDAYFNAALDLATRYHLPMVATNNVIFNEESNFEGHEIKTCIQNKEYMDDPKRQKIYSKEQYLKTPEQMAEIFKSLPSALDNSVEIAKRCNLKMEWDKVELPPFTTEQGQSERDLLNSKLEQSLQALSAQHPDLDTSIYEERIAYELGVIEKMGYEGYFLIVADFIAWAKNNGIPVGPGRGSGSGSLVAYLLGITEIDPIEYDLLFERFLNPDRVSMPDFDIDFCIRGRDKVIRYVEERYGVDKVSYINTFNTLLAKAAIRDTARVLGAPHTLADRIAKMIPDRIPSPSLDEAYKESKDLRTECKSEAMARDIFDKAKKIEGLARNPGRHAGGIVIAPKPLTHYTAVYQEEGSEGVVSHFDMKDIEKVGLVKFDFLGLKTLTIIHRCVEHILQHRGEEIDITQIDLSDEKTYQLLQKADSTAIFQLESQGIRQLMKSLHPDCFNDIVALIALYRPGPLQSGMSDQYAERKRGAPFDYMDPTLEPILKTTYGIILYQEQVMEIARELAGYSMGRADLLRRAMGKKIPAEMAQQRETFIQGAVEKGLKKGVAKAIFDLIEHFAGYGFNKSHSVAYAMLAYRTAWLKANYPAEFMATVMTEDSNDSDKLAFYINECSAMGINVLPVDINQSEVEFRAVAEGIRFGLCGIRNISSYMIQNLTAERKDNGAFQSIDDFCMRMASHVKKSAADILIKAGAFDGFEPNRALLLDNIEAIVQMAEQELANQNMGQSALFESDVSDMEHKKAVQLEGQNAFSQEEMLRLERQTLGFYLTAHPVDMYQAEVNSIASYRLRQLLDTPLEEMEQRYGKNGSLLVAGVIMKKQRKFIRKAQAVLFDLDDGTGQIDVALFDKDYENCKEMLEQDNVVFVEIYRVNYGAEQSIRRWRARNIYSLDQARAQFAKSLLINLQVNGNAPDIIGSLKDSFQPYCDPQGCRIFIDMVTEQASTRLELGERWQVKPCQTLLNKLQHIDGIDSVTVNYSGH